MYKTYMNNKIMYDLFYLDYNNILITYLSFNNFSCKINNHNWVKFKAQGISRYYLIMIYIGFVCFVIKIIKKNCFIDVSIILYKSK